MKLRKIYYILGLTLMCGVASPAVLIAQTSQLESRIKSAVEATVPQDMGIGKINILGFNIDPNEKLIIVNLKENYSDVPFSKESITKLKEDIHFAAGKEYQDYSVKILINGIAVEQYLADIEFDVPGSKERFITPLNSSYRYKKGLDGNVIALWQSHGWYFEPKLNRWEWQRARIFQTVEDLFTQSYVMPYLMPMLENAGAYVMSPRERDVNTYEVIIDNDGGLAHSGYVENNGNKKWKKGKTQGFAYNRIQYEGVQNPFSEGTYREIDAINDKKKISTASWNTEIPNQGEYAVYVSYASLPQSVNDATYTINYLGGSSQFKVNQKMGGGTWIYLGHFLLAKGLSEKPIVELTNRSKNEKAIITADAIKIGGGYGNIARIVQGVSENVKSSDSRKDTTTIAIPRINYKYQLSNHPRYTEGARYWLQWAGVPDSVYTPSGNINDYTDDYRCRGLWVNYLAGGSSVLPNNKGLNIPVDLAFAFHSDAGTTRNDSIIGTLGIYYTNKFAKYANGVPRVTSRRLTDLIMTNIVSDVRKQYEPHWMRRGMWDKSYYEARVPEVPTMLLELLSHQNFADMKYGLDPSFRFTVSRAIYKGMLEFLAERDDREYVVQPLPVNSFNISKADDEKFLLSWKETKDTLCDKAKPSEYIIQERIADGGFKDIAKVKGAQYVVTIKDNDIHSYRIIAINEGGRSFPSETLALGISDNSKGDVLVVNGFTRISAPDWFDSGKMAGFYDEKDHGVPYMEDICYIGSQFEYRRNIPWMDDDAAGFGASRANYETKVIAGNNFDYPYIHGRAIMDAGYSFVSSSVKAVEDGIVNLNSVKTVDLILGKQKETIIGRGAVPNKFKAFTPALQNAISEFTSRGGNIFISGAYVATDIWDKENVNKNDIKFAENVLGYKWRVGQASVTGEAYTVPTIFSELKDNNYSFNNTLNETMYIVESPDSFFPADDKTGSTFMRYGENNLIAGIVTSKNGYKTCVIGFPFETIKGDFSRATLMKQILNFFENK